MMVEVISDQAVHNFDGTEYKRPLDTWRLFDLEQLSYTECHNMEDQLQTSENPNCTT